MERIHYLGERQQIWVGLPFLQQHGCQFHIAIFDGDVKRSATTFVDGVSAVTLPEKIRHLKTDVTL